jgi:hypothetical protein
MAFLEAMTIFSPGASSLLDSSDSFYRSSFTKLLSTYTFGFPITCVKGFIEITKRYH